METAVASHLFQERNCLQQWQICRLYWNSCPAASQKFVAGLQGFKRRATARAIKD